jgi:hypothetical protein
MEITSIHKYISLNKLANGTTEVVFAGQPCLSVAEGVGGSLWKINPVFAKLVYGANIFEDIPVCNTVMASTEEAVAAGLVKLHELGAFNTEVDFPEDTYAATIVSISEDAKNHALKNTGTIFEAYIMYNELMKVVDEDRSEYSANVGLSGSTGITAKKKIYLKSASGTRLSGHDSEKDAIRAWKAMPSNKGVKIMREDTDVTEDLLKEDTDAEYEKWEASVRATHPTKNLKFKGRLESGAHTTSAEESGKDRSYGVWDHDKNEGHVLGEETEEKEIKEVESAIKKDKKFISKLGQDSK